MRHSSTSDNFYKYTNAVIVVKGNNPFVVSPANQVPKLNKNHYSGNDHLRKGFVDNNGNSNHD